MNSLSFVQLLFFILPEFAFQQRPFDDDQLSIKTEKEEYDPSKVTPVLFGKMHAEVGFFICFFLESAPPTIFLYIKN